MPLIFSVRRRQFLPTHPCAQATARQGNRKGYTRAGCPQPVTQPFDNELGEGLALLESSSLRFLHNVIRQVECRPHTDMLLMMRVHDISVQKGKGCCREGFVVVV